MDKNVHIIKEIKIYFPTKLLCFEMNNRMKQTGSKTSFYLLKQKNVVFSWSSTRNVARLAPFQHFFETLLFLNLQETLERDRKTCYVTVFLFFVEIEHAQTNQTKHESSTVMLSQIFKNFRKDIFH